MKLYDVLNIFALISCAVLIVGLQEILFPLIAEFAIAYPEISLTFPFFCALFVFAATRGLRSCLNLFR